MTLSSPRCEAVKRCVTGPGHALHFSSVSVGWHDTVYVLMVTYTDLLKLMQRHVGTSFKLQKKKLRSLVAICHDAGN